MPYLAIICQKYVLFTFKHLLYNLLLVSYLIFGVTIIYLYASSVMPSMETSNNFLIQNFSTTQQRQQHDQFLNFVIFIIHLKFVLYERF